MILTRSWACSLAITTTPMTSRSGHRSHRRPWAQTDSRSHLSLLGLRPSTRKLSTGGSNLGRLYCKHKQRRCVGSIDSGKSQPCLRRELYYKAAVSGILSLLWAARLLSLSCSVPRSQRWFFRSRAHWPKTNWRPPTLAYRRSTIQAIFWQIRRIDSWCFAILARDGRTSAALIVCSVFLPKTSISQLWLVSRIALYNPSPHYGNSYDGCKNRRPPSLSCSSDAYWHR